MLRSRARRRTSISSVVITPEAQDITYPSLLDFPAPALSGYPRETVVAEKFQAMVYLSTLNSRMKDFYDVWLLATQFAFDGPGLAKAMAATFANRGTKLDGAPTKRCAEESASTSATCPTTQASSSRRGCAIAKQAYE